MPLRLESMLRSLVTKIGDSGTSVSSMLVISGLTTLITYAAISFLGFQVATILLGVLILALGLSAIPNRLIVITVFWLLSMSGFRNLFILDMPGLPDFSIDRLLLVVIILLFWFQVATKQNHLRGPYLPDMLIGFHTIYILVQLQFKNPHAMHFWTLSSLTPFFAYIYGKNVIKSPKQLRIIFIFLLGLSIYYYTQSISEKFGMNYLIFPKVILNKAIGMYQVNRSRGPFLHPPLFGQIMGMVLFSHFIFINRRAPGSLPWIALLLSLGLSFLGLFFSFTRGPWIATTAGLIVLGIMSKNSRKTLAVFGILVVIVGSVGILSMLNSDALQERVGNTHTIENRLGFLATAFAMLKYDPLFGIGFFRYPDLMEVYNLGANIPLYGYVPKSISAVAVHDIYIGRLAEEGLVGGMLIFGFFMVSMAQVARNWRAAPKEGWFNRDVLSVCAALMVTFLVGGMVIDYRYFDLVNSLFCLFAGIQFGGVARNA